MALALAITDDVAQLTLGGLKATWERWFGPVRFERKLERLQQAGLIEPDGKGGELDRVVRLTAAGRLAAAGGREPQARWLRPWDGQWRLAFFDVAEAKRTMRVRLQRQLRRTGFGYLQDSVWISPDTVKEIQAALGQGKADAAALTFITGRPCAGETDADLVRGAWDFVAINRNYQIYLEVLRACPQRGSLASRRNWLNTEWRAWTHALRSDPLLPEALLPSSYIGRDAWKRRQEVFRRSNAPG